MARNEIRITIFKPFEVKKINEFLLTRNKLTNDFASQVKSNFGSNVARKSPVVLR